MLGAIAAGADLERLGPAITELGSQLDELDTQRLVDAIVERVAEELDMERALAAPRRKAA